MKHMQQAQTNASGCHIQMIFLNYRRLTSENLIDRGTIPDKYEPQNITTTRHTKIHFSSIVIVCYRLEIWGYLSSSISGRDGIVVRSFVDFVKCIRINNATDWNDEYYIYKMLLPRSWCW